MSTAIHHRATPTRCAHGHFMHTGDTTCHACGASPAAPPPRLSLVKAPPLPHRTPNTTDLPFTDAEIGEARAALAAALAGIRAPVMGWKASATGGAQQHLADGTLLHHPGTHDQPFEATIPCLLGAHHLYEIHSAADLNAARRSAYTCEQPHADLSGIEAPAFTDLTKAFGQNHDPETTVPIPLQQMPEARDGR